MLRSLHAQALLQAAHSSPWDHDAVTCGSWCVSLLYVSRRDVPRPGKHPFKTFDDHRKELARVTATTKGLTARSNNTTCRALRASLPSPSPKSPGSSTPLETLGLPAHLNFGQSCSLLSCYILCNTGIPAQPFDELLVAVSHTLATPPLACR